MKRFVATAALALALAGAALFVRAEGVDVADGSAGRVNAVAFLDRSGMMLGVIDEHGDRSIDVPLAAVSPNFVRAVLAAEDARFYRHGPIEVRSVLRAAWQDFIYGAPVSGASTITMQLARLLDPGATQSKAAQALYAARIELRSSKDAILAAYVNRIPMGGALAGVEAAARAYFGVPAADLDLAQAALLAAIPNDPPQLEPRRNWGAAKIRQRYVLARMVALGWATREAAARAAREPLHLHADGAALIAPHLLFALYPRVANAALPVRTTIDADLQRFVQAQVADVAGALSAEHVEDAAAIVVDNASGEVLAYAGSPDYFSDVALGRNDGVQALRQPGSTLKPFLYELALERGAIEPNSILLDAPVAYAIPGGKLYQPADYNGGFAGPVRVRYALANSLNVPAVRVLSKVGVSAFLARLRALGFNGLQRPASYYGLGLTLGSGEVSLWQLAQAYTTLARRGDAVALTALSNEPVAARSIGDSRVWMLVTKMLADPHARALSFGVHSVLQLPFEAAVKTGTSSDYRDTWTVGFTRTYTVATWVGNFDGSPMQRVSGVAGAAPLWNRIMLHLHERRDPGRFEDPPGMHLTRICATTGAAPQRGCSAVVEEYLARAAPPPRRARMDGGILFPQDGAVFFLSAAPPNAPIMQRLEMRGAGDGPARRWTIDGAALPRDAEGHAFWTLRVGRWKLGYAGAGESRTVHFSVLAQPPRTRPGFTFGAPLEGTSGRRARESRVLRRSG